MLSKCVVRIDTVGTLSTSLGSLFQGLATLSAKKYFLISSLFIPWDSFESFSCILALDTRNRRSAPSSPPPQEEERAVGAVRSLLNLLFQTSPQDIPQPLLTGHSFQIFPQLCCKDLHIHLKLWDSELHTALYERPHQC